VVFIPSVGMETFAPIGALKVKGFIFLGGGGEATSPQKDDSTLQPEIQS